MPKGKKTYKNKRNKHPTLFPGKLFENFLLPHKKPVIKSTIRAGKTAAGSEKRPLQRLVQRTRKKEIIPIDKHLSALASAISATKAERAKFREALETLKEHPINANDPLIRCCMALQLNTCIRLKNLIDFIYKGRKIDFKEIIKPFLREGLRPEDINIELGLRPTILMEYDAEYVLRLMVKDEPVALLSFDYYPGKRLLSIEQIQGVSGFDALAKGFLTKKARRFQKKIRWERALVRCAVVLADLIGAKRVRLAHSEVVIKRNNVPLKAQNSVKMHYDVTAKREGFRLAHEENKKYWVKELH